MPICKVCGQELRCINYLHLRTHGYKSTKEYLTDFPDAEIGAPNLQRKEIVYRDRARIKAIAGGSRKISLKDDTGEGPDGSLEVSQNVYLRLRKFKTDYELSFGAAIDKLLELYYKLKDNPVTQEVMGKRIYELDDMPEDFVPQHREILQQLLIKYENMIADEIKKGDLKNLSTHLERLAKINTVLPELEKSYQTNMDIKIKRVIESRKAVCKNKIPEIVNSVNAEEERY